jgi:ectoine hydroxylase-related dioxygenase (phytanoyl-CoA dioxygenase family)
MLTPEQVARYREHGYLLPLRAMSEEEAVALLARIDAVTPADVADLPHPWYYKAYLLFTWLDALVRDPRILTPVKDILGPDVTVMSADIWRKVPGEARHISWHQDASYWSLEPLEILTAWIALTPATRENGCMRFAPGSHKQRVAHRNTFAADNMLSHGQTAELEIDEVGTVDDVLAPGEMSLHHALLVHASGPNGTSAPRVGLAIRYLPGDVRQLGRPREGPPVSVMPVSGRPTGNLLLETPPKHDLSPEAIAQHTQLLAPHAATRYVNF